MSKYSSSHHQKRDNWKSKHGRSGYRRSQSSDESSDEYSRRRSESSREKSSHSKSHHSFKRHSSKNTMKKVELLKSKIKSDLKDAENYMKANANMEKEVKTMLTDGDRWKEISEIEKSGFAPQSFRSSIHERKMDKKKDEGKFSIIEEERSTFDTLENASDYFEGELTVPAVKIPEVLCTDANKKFSIWLKRYEELNAKTN
ncbi:Indole-3-glycerol phosphate synthase [Trichinella pseudospiralis]